MGPTVATVSTVLLSLLLFIPATLPDHTGKDVDTPDQAPKPALPRDVVNLGCWRDKDPDRAIPSLEGTDPRLDGGYKARKNAIQKCYQVAKDRGFSVFALQNGGHCRSGLTYETHGPSTACYTDGEGGPLGNQVYQITAQHKTFRCDSYMDESVDLSCNRGVLRIESVKEAPSWGHDLWKVIDLWKVSESSSDIGKICNDKPSCHFQPREAIKPLCYPHHSYKVSYSCEELDPCKKDPCEHGRCVANRGQYTCNCYGGWTGKNCNVNRRMRARGNRHDCWPNPCQNGDCVPVPDHPFSMFGYSKEVGYRCECHDGWTGHDCSDKIDPCRGNPCQHGSCVAEDWLPSYECKCDSGWTGKNCNQQIDPCATKPCQHGSCTKVDGVNYKCRCLPTWTGKNCNQRIDFCKTRNPCRHGTCENLENAFACKCASGWSGKYCTDDVNECYTKPCHFGTCANTDGGYSCHCDRGWDGQNCTKKTNDKTTVYLSHDSRARLVCQHGVLDVVSAQYRQDPTHGCQDKTSVCFVTCDSHRMDQYAATSVRKKCNGKWYCDIVASPSFLLKGRDPCGNVKKRLEVGYRCVEAQSGATATKAGTTTSKRTENIFGPSLTVICRSTGDPPPSISWRRGEKIVSDDNRHTVKEESGRRGGESYLESRLSIADLPREDPDNERYVCWAGNDGDKESGTSSMVKVLVTGIFITAAGIGATAFVVFYFRKRDLNSSKNSAMHGSASPMPGRLRPLPSLPKPRFSMTKGPQTAIAILDFLKPIPVANLKKEFNQRLANEEKLFTDEYEALPKLLGEEHSQACQQNRDKNRFRNIISYDHSRVILSLVDGDPRTDYINASYIDGYNGEKKYIATQGPMQNTVGDFWRMIWETGSSTILMLSNLVENCQNKVCKYWSETDTMTYGNFHVTLLRTNKMDYYIARTFQLIKDNVSARREVTQFHFLAWPDFGVPDDPTDLLKFHQTVMTSVPPQNRPIVVHCSAGVGRTGTFITIDAMLEMMAVEKQVDVFGFVSKMRRNRSFMVQAKAQYIFIYQALLDSYLRDEVRTGKRKWWPPSAAISQIGQMARAQRAGSKSAV